MRGALQRETRAVATISFEPLCRAESIVPVESALLGAEQQRLRSDTA